MNEKKDKNFGKAMLNLAREVYGKDFLFSQCTIIAHREDEFTVRFDMTEGETPPEPTEMSNFDKLSNLEKDANQGADSNNTPARKGDFSPYELAEIEGLFEKAKNPGRECYYLDSIIVKLVSRIDPEYNPMAEAEGV